MPPQAQPSIKDLLAKAVADSKRLATAQVALTKAEIGASGQKVGVGAGLGMATLALIFFGVLFLLVTLALVLVELGLPPWAGFLIVAALIMIGAIVTALLARKSFNDVKPPSLAIAEFEKTKAALSGISSQSDGAEAELPPITGT